MSKLIVFLFVFGTLAVVTIAKGRGSGSSSSSEEDDLNVECFHNVNFTMILNGQRNENGCGAAVANGNIADRCIGCCYAYGFSKGYDKDTVVGFVGAAGDNCVCCHWKQDKKGRKNYGNRDRYFF